MIWCRPCALHQGGTISCWGNNGSGQLGGTHDEELQAQIEELQEKAKQPGASATLATELLSLRAQANAADAFVPVRVTNITDATAIATGNAHSCALHQDGTISCWGRNYNRQLGDGTDNDSSVPVRVTNITDATAIAAGYEHSCALHQGGTISCWGNNGSGQLGGTHDEELQAQIEELQEKAKQPGASATLATELLSLRAQANAADAFVPVRVTNITDATAIATGNAHSCALHQDGTISCWGWNEDGQLGDGTWRLLPLFVVGFGG